MTGKFQWKKFKDVNLNDAFFDSLKDDYPEFEDWFQRKADEDKSALVFNDEYGIGAFLYLKREEESLLLIDETLPSAKRLKIGTLRLAERIRGQRLGEGALGVALWYWRERKFSEIYVTIYKKHIELINLFERFGFKKAGENLRGECVYVKSRENLDYASPYKCFPFLLPASEKCGLLPIKDTFHDKLFPYSELVGTRKEIVEATAGNGITKVFIAAPVSAVHYTSGMPVMIYRIHTGDGQKAYKSAITSYCTITNVDVIKDRGHAIVGLNEFIKKVGNKTIFSLIELTALYNQKSTVVVIELIYNGYFGKGHNVIFKKLKENGLFESYPYNISYTKEQFIKILEMGGNDVQNTFID